MRRTALVTAVRHVRRKADGAICVVDADQYDPVVYDLVDAPVLPASPETVVQRLQREVASARAELELRPARLDPEEARLRLEEEIRLRVPKGIHNQRRARAGVKRVAAIRARERYHAMQRTKQDDG